MARPSVQPRRARSGADARYEERDWYTLPRYYDWIYGEGTRREARFLEAMVARHGRLGRQRVLEPACGSGRLVLELARRGWRATGFDASAPMLEFARARLAARGLRARLLEARLERVPALGRFELAHCLVSSFKYLGSESAARAHLRAIARALVPGGLYVLGIDLAHYADRQAWRERWSARRGRCTVVNEVIGAPPNRRTRSEAMRARLSVRRTAAAGRRARAPERYVTHWSFRTYDLAELRALLAAVPELELVAVHGYDCDARRPHALDGERLDHVLVLRRRASSSASRERARTRRRGAR